MSKIYGADFSHWQGKIDWSKVTAKFVFLKCTEGTSYTDPTYDTNKKGARENNILVGSYHFAKGLDAKKEAKYFYNSVGDFDDGELLALDFEITIPNPVNWCLVFLEELEKLCGFKPMIYLSHSFLKKYDWTPVSQGNYGLWAARYGLNTGYLMTAYKPSTGSWGFYAIWQYTSNGRLAGISGKVDLNEAQMDLETLKKYGWNMSQVEQVKPYVIVLPNEPQRYNCVLFARRYVPSLPYGLWTLGAKKKIINASQAKIGSVAVINAGAWGHVAVVTGIEKNGMVIIKEANYKAGKITERRDYPANLKILGFFKPNK